MTSLLDQYEQASQRYKGTVGTSLRPEMMLLGEVGPDRVGGSFLDKVSKGTHHPKLGPIAPAVSEMCLGFKGYPPPKDGPYSLCVSRDESGVGGWGVGGWWRR
uniref:Uncharacterized protein n=1 Tax=Timema tahoe TaxID=61484 RepID=A0A7R9NW47_9NEOP|nr:unnamed protein product [Timema tahoe]